MLNQMISGMDGTTKAVVMAWIGAALPVFTVWAALKLHRLSDWIDDKTTMMK